ncbi:MAG: glycosyl transferase family 1 [Rhodocyclales bacterium]|nr:glycosyl transferase family 1 [Rhodocyclales bacterium]
MQVRQNGEIESAAFEQPARAPNERLRVLIIHQNFPGQFRHLVQHLHNRADVEVIGLGRDTAPGLKIGKVEFPWFKYKLHRQVKTETHPYLRQMEAAVLHGQAVARALGELKAKGFTPDIILAHPGWGETLYAKEIFPQVKLIHFCEWYYSTSGADFNFDPEFPSTLDDHLRITTWNALHLLNLENCDTAITPTHWQKSQFPAAYQDKIQVIHEGIDAQNLRPDPHAELVLPIRHSREGGNPAALQKGSDSVELTFRAGDPIITYIARNLEPYRGFHILMRALPKVLKEHATAQILIIGGDGRSYGAMPKDAPNWREKMLREVGSELGDNQQRLHFLGKVPYETYKKILQVSAVHVYLTYPFVLSWSLLEAMATGCHIIASDTAPVREVIRHNENGVLTDFFDADQLAERMLAALNDQTSGKVLRERARVDAQSYALDQGLAAYQRLLNLPIWDKDTVS